VIKANGINTPAKVVSVQDKKYIILMIPYVKGIIYNNGTVINDSRLAGAKNAIDRFKQDISDSKSSNFIDTTTTKNIDNHTNNFGLEQPKPTTNNQQPTTNNTNHSKKVIPIILIIAAIVIAVSAYKHYVTKK